MPIEIILKYAAGMCAVAPSPFNVSEFHTLQYRAICEEKVIECMVRGDSKEWCDKEMRRLVKDSKEKLGIIN